MKKSLLIGLFALMVYESYTQTNQFVITREPYNSDGYLVLSDSQIKCSYYNIYILEQAIDSTSLPTYSVLEKISLIGKNYFKFPSNYLVNGNYFFQVLGFSSNGAQIFDSGYLPCTGGGDPWSEINRFTCDGSDYAYAIQELSQPNGNNYIYSLTGAFQYVSSTDNTAVPLYEYMYLSDYYGITDNPNTNLVDYFNYHGIGYSPGMNISPNGHTIGDNYYVFAPHNTPVPFQVRNRNGDLLSSSLDDVIALKKGMGNWEQGIPVSTGTTFQDWSSIYSGSVVSLLSMFNQSSNIADFYDSNNERIFPDLTCDGDLISGNLVGDDGGNGGGTFDCMDLITFEDQNWEGNFQAYVDCIGLVNLNERELVFSDWSDGSGEVIGNLNIRSMIDEDGNFKPISVNLSPGLYLVAQKSAGIYEHLNFVEASDTVNIQVPMSSLVQVNLYANPIVNGTYKIAYTSIVNAKVKYSVFDLNSNKLSEEIVQLAPNKNGVIDYQLKSQHMNKDLLHIFEFVDGSALQVHSSH